MPNVRMHNVRMEGFAVQPPCYWLALGYWKAPWCLKSIFLLSSTVLQTSSNEVVNLIPCSLPYSIVQGQLLNNRANPERCHSKMSTEIRIHLSSFLCKFYERRKL